MGLKLDYQALSGNLLTIARSSILLRLRATEESEQLNATNAREIINAAREGKTIEFHPTSPSTTATNNAATAAKPASPPVAATQGSGKTLAGKTKPLSQPPVNQKSRATLEKEELTKLSRQEAVKEAEEVRRWLTQLLKNRDVARAFELGKIYPELYRSLFPNKEAKR